MKAPAFRLPSDAGTPVALKDFAGRTVVLYFYPKDDTTGCTTEACDFRDNWRAVRGGGRRGARRVAGRRRQPPEIQKEV